MMTDDDYCVHGLNPRACFTCGKEYKEPCKTRKCWCKNISAESAKKWREYFNLSAVEIANIKTDHLERQLHCLQRDNLMLQLKVESLLEDLPQNFRVLQKIVGISTHCGKCEGKGIFEKSDCVTSCKECGGSGIIRIEVKR